MVKTKLHFKIKKQINECAKTEFKLSKTQKKLTEYYKPSNKEKGLILYHSVGSGKTCAAISIATNFEDKDYSILWVTRNSIKNIVYQNLFGDKICHPKIDPKKLGNTQQKRFGHFNKVTNKAWFKPVSYKTLSNIVSRKSKLYKELIKKNGTSDPLKKTLLIIDEAHNFMVNEPIGLTTQERGKIKNLQKLVYDSYEKSGNNSVRLLILTATPGLNGAVGAINMLNLLIVNENNRMPTEVNTFVETFLEKDMESFSISGKKVFMENTKNLVSFLDASKDYSKFAKLSFETLNEPLSLDRRHLKNRLEAIRKVDPTIKCGTYTKLKKRINSIINAKGISIDMKILLVKKIFRDINKKELKPLFIDTKKLFKVCKNKRNPEACIAGIKKNQKRIKDKINNYIKTDIEECKTKRKNTIIKLKSKIGKNKILINKNQEDSIKKCDKLPIKKQSQCIKDVIMWNDTYKNVYNFTHTAFNKNTTKKMLPIISTKLDSLLDNITKLDKVDRIKHKKLFKHVIYVDNKKYIKYIISALLSNKFKFVYKKGTKDIKRKGRTIKAKTLELNITKSKNNFGVMTSAQIYKKALSKNFITKVQDIFNKRPVNINGNKIRFMIIDKKFTEGVSFFDVKYLHILTEPTTAHQMKQLAGRIVRRCGHAGMKKTNNKWRINAIIYNSIDEDETDYNEFIKYLDTKDLKASIEHVVVKEMKDNRI